MKKIKFYITPVYPYGNDHYYHEIIAVAEGMIALGFDIFGNCNYWFQPEKNEYLIKEDVNNKNFDIAIYDYRYVKSFEHLLFRPNYPNFDKTKKHILIDRNDWISPIWNNNKHYQIFDVICAANLYSNYKYSKNVKPWAIGLTNRIMNGIDLHYDKNKLRTNITGHNFRVDHNMRGYVLNRLQNQLLKYPATTLFSDDNKNTETDNYYNTHSTQRHNSAYYKNLSECKFHLAFGGYYEYKPFCYQPYTLINKIFRKINYWKYNYARKNKTDFSKQIFVFQQDNFRFWEVLYSGSIAINLNLKYWNFLLPQMPVSGEHYIGIANLHDDVESKIKILSDEQITQMSKNARQWVTDNYSPKAQANRILYYLNEK